MSPGSLPLMRALKRFLYTHSDSLPLSTGIKQVVKLTVSPDNLRKYASLTAIISKITNAGEVFIDFSDTLLIPEGAKIDSSAL
jgi:hypothetical protein